MTALIKILCFTLPLLLCGCATLNRSECQNADWRMIGLEDGSKGRDMAYIGNHRKACAKYNISPDLELYQAGHDQGIGQYCTYIKGFQLGKGGGKYQGVCPAALEKDFLLGLQRGREIHSLTQEINRAESAIRSKLNRIADLDDEEQDKERLVISAKTSERGRRRLLEEIKQIQAEIAYLDSEIEMLERRQAAAGSELQVLQERYRY